MADQMDSDGKADKAVAASASDVKAPTPAIETPVQEAPQPVAATPAAAPIATPAPAAKAAEPAPAPAPAPAKAAVKKAPARKAAVKKAPVTKAATPKAATPKAVTPKAAASKKPAKKPVAKKAPTKPATAIITKKAAAMPAAKKTPAAATKAPAKPAATPTKSRTIIELKEMIMATKTTDITDMMSKSMTAAVADMQSKAQEAYAKGNTMVADMTEVAKGNVEAIVESGKLLASAMQDMGKTYADEAKSLYETTTADLKQMASVKSPTELFQLQGTIMRRNLDALIASSSKTSESAMKLANDVMAPITARVNVAVEKISKAA